MKRARTALALAAVIAVAAFAPQRAAGQAASASSSARSKAAPSASAAAPHTSAQPSASAMPAGHPPVDGEMPAGHPSVDGDMPEGHPQVGDEDVENPHAHGKRGMNSQFFEPPADTAADDASLPPGTLIVTIKDARDIVVPRAQITLSVLHSTVAKGDTNERLDRVADESGSVRFDGLAFGTGHSFRASTSRGPAVYGASFGLSQGAGKRVTVHSYEASGALEDLPIAMQGMIYISLREDSIQVDQRLSIYNLGAVSWLANAPIELPKGFKALNKQEGLEDAHVEELPGMGAALRGTFPPGRRDLDFRYQVPLTNEASQTLKIKLPPRVAQGQVIAEASRSMTLAVNGFPAANRVDGRDGKHLLVTEAQSPRGSGGLTTIDVTLGGLPTTGPGRWIAAALAVVLFGAGLSYWGQSRSGGAIDEDARRDLIEAREALLGEIVSLERAHKSGDIGPKTYARVRASLLDALARIVTMIDEARPKTKAGRRMEPST